MAESDPSTPQVVDPELTVDLTRLLQIRGPLGVLNVLDTIVPVVNMGDVATSTVKILQPAFRSTDIFSEGVQIQQPANTLLADTGALAEGVYDVNINMTSGLLEVNQTFQVQWRNAANSANLAVWPHVIRMVDANSISISLALALDFGATERLRILQMLASGINSDAAAVIFARRRA
jgi:hypothetical protein